MKRIRVSCDARGRVRVEMDGFQGDACLAVLEGLVARLGKSGASLQPTADFYAANAATEQQKTTT